MRSSSKAGSGGAGSKKNSKKAGGVTVPKSLLK